MSRQLPDQLQTRRLVLREPREADARLIFDAYTQDAAVTRYMIWRPHKALSETEGFVAQCIRDWHNGNRQAYVLTFANDIHKPIGMLDTRLLSHIVDIGYVLARPYWGAGLMPEAIDAIARAALDLPTVYRVQATCDVENVASARALEKAGFMREGHLSRYIIHPNLSPEPRSCFICARCK